jgi:multidrug transporter EmrE-like cation transporter
MAWLILLVAVVLEVAGISLLRVASRRGRPPLFVGAGLIYVVSVLMILWSARTIGVGVTYAVWSGLGTALVAAAGALIFEEELPPLRILCIVAIVVGVVGLKLLAPGDELPDALLQDVLPAP